jgi:hypothetical protein
MGTRVTSLSLGLSLDCHHPCNLLLLPCKIRGAALLPLFLLPFIWCGIPPPRLLLVARWTAAFGSPVRESARALRSAPEPADLSSGKRRRDQGACVRLGPRPFRSLGASPPWGLRRACASGRVRLPASGVENLDQANSFQCDSCCR